MIRVASRHGIRPTELWGMYEWELAALMGVDLVDHEGIPLSQKGSIRQQHSQRAARLEQLPDEVKEARRERVVSREERRRRQREDPEWRAQVKAAQAAAPKQVQTDPGRVVPSDQYTIVR